MIWRGRVEKARAELASGDRLRLIRPGGDDIVVHLDRVTSIAFIQIGDDTAPVFEGWWMLCTPTGAIVASDECAGLDPLLRRSGIPVVGAVADKSILFLLSRPCVMRGRAARDGVVSLDSTTATALMAKGTVEPVGAIADMPIVS